MKVLIAEDDDSLRQAIRTYLESAGHEVFEAMDGEQAAVVFLKEQPDSVIIDLILPGTHGIEGISRIRKSSTEVVIIAMSGVHQEQIIREALDAGADHYLPKPFGLEELASVLRRDPGKAD